MIVKSMIVSMRIELMMNFGDVFGSICWCLCFWCWVVRVIVFLGVMVGGFFRRSGFLVLDILVSFWVDEVIDEVYEEVGDEYGEGDYEEEFLY